MQALTSKPPATMPPMIGTARCNLMAPLSPHFTTNFVPTACTPKGPGSRIHALVSRTQMDTRKRHAHYFYQ
eukprot:22574-Pyramimonas_sp.AAC.1